jgi:EAL domain-containing protein (putative c-di-GMP-specific phosphodiesterase class I)
MDSATVTRHSEYLPVSDSGPTIAFQPIADTAGGGRAYAYEAIVRGREGESADELYAALSAESRGKFEARCAAASIRWAMAAGLGTSGARLSIPLHAAAIDSPADHIQPALQACRETGLVPERLIFALKGYQALSGAAIADIIDRFDKLGPRTAFVGIGEDQAGLGLAGRYKPTLVKLEPEWVDGIDGSWSRRIRLEDLTPRTRSLGLRIAATGVHRDPILERLPGYGITLIQGDAIAAPQVRALPRFSLRRNAA